MARLEIQLANEPPVEVVILVNNKRLKFKRGNNGNKTAIMDLDTNLAKVEIFTVNEFDGPFWWLFAIFFYIITVFGLFNPRYDKNGRCLNYQGNMELYNDNLLILNFNYFKNNEKAFVNRGNALLEDNDSNKYYIDEKLVKRVKWYKRIKKLMFLLIITLVIVSIIMSCS